MIERKKKNVEYLVKQSVHRGAGVRGVSKAMRVVCETGQETQKKKKK